MSEEKQVVEYTLGFAFDEHSDYVLLIQKKRPEWQEGKTNGIGGKVEAFDEDAYHAQAREFREEAGIDTKPEDWKLFATMSSDIFKVDCFWTILPDINKYSSITDEIVHKVFIRDIDAYLTCPNVEMLIAMATNDDIRAGRVEVISLNYLKWPFTS